MATKPEAPTAPPTGERTFAAFASDAMAMKGEPMAGVLGVVDKMRGLPDAVRANVLCMMADKDFQNNRGQFYAPLSPAATNTAQQFSQPAQKAGIKVDAAFDPTAPMKKLDMSRPT